MQLNASGSAQGRADVRDFCRWRRRRRRSSSGGGKKLKQKTLKVTYALTFLYNYNTIHAMLHNHHLFTPNYFGFYSISPPPPCTPSYSGGDTYKKCFLFKKQQRGGARHSGAPMLRKYAATSAFLRSMAHLSAVAPQLQGR
jgi:hypothetical protein